MTAIILKVLAGILVVLVWAQVKIPFISSTRSAIVLLAFLDMAICSQGIGYVASKKAWLHPLSIAGYSLGLYILAIAVAALFNKQMPPFTSDRQVFFAIAILMVTKSIISFIHRLLP